MLKNYLTIALRTLRRQRLYAGINTAGLAIGLACVALVVLYTQHELGYDRQHPAADRTYQVNPSLRGQWYSITGYENWNSATEAEQLALTRALEAVPEVERAVQLHVDQAPRYVRSGAQRSTEDAILYTNTAAAFAETFGLEVLDGQAGAFRRPQTAVLRAGAAERLFGEEPAVGRTIEVDTLAYEVVAVAAEGAPTHLGFDLALHVPRIPHWGAYAYVVLTPGADPAAVTPKISAALDRARPSRIGNVTVEGERLMAVTDLHFAGDRLYPITPPGDRQYLVLFGIAALLVLLITCINYTNLSVATYAGRQKEVGVRKAVGAGRAMVAGQFVLEALVLALLCVPLALGLVELGLPFLSHVMEVPLRNGFLREPGLFGSLVLLAMATGLAASAYPAVLLARRRAVDLFHGGRGGARQGGRLRKMLVTAQFVLLIGLGSLAFLMHQQVQYVQTRDTGIAVDGVVQLGGLGDVVDYERLRTRLEAQPAVQAVGWGGTLRQSFNQLRFQGEGQEAVYDDGNVLGVSLSWFDVVGMEAPALEQWQDESRAAPDVLAFINETARQRLGWADPVGKTVYEDPGGGDDGRGYPFVVAGVVPDANLFSLHERVRPLFVFAYPAPSYVYDVVVRLNTQDLPGAMAAVEAAWAEVMPQTPFTPQFADATLAAFYASDRRASRLSAYLCGLAVALAALGLFGLSAFVAGVRQKEVGVRKVLGASVGQILVLLNREFVGLVLVALCVAAPAAYLMAGVWLDRFAYRISVSPWVFVAAGALALLLALASVSYQALRAALVNPTEVLRDE